MKEKKTQRFRDGNSRERFAKAMDQMDLRKSDKRLILDFGVVGCDVVYQCANVPLWLCGQVRVLWYRVCEPLTT